LQSRYQIWPPKFARVGDIPNAEQVLSYTSRARRQTLFSLSLFCPDSRSLKFFGFLERTSELAGKNLTGMTVSGLEAFSPLPLLPSTERGGAQTSPQSTAQLPIMSILSPIPPRLRGVQEEGRGPFGDPMSSNQNIPKVVAASAII
jgi:hypothetical protein